MTLPEKLVALHEALDDARIPHAFGGAIALAFWTLQPRGTSDIDINIFVPATDCGAALAALPAAVSQPDGTTEAIARDGQVRLWWDRTPIDLFFDYEAIHADAAQNAQAMPFEDTHIPVLGPVELAVFKAMFDRTRDWADIEAMFGSGRVTVDAVKATLGRLLPPDDHRFARLDEAARLAGAP